MIQDRSLQSIVVDIVVNLLLFLTLLMCALPLMNVLALSFSGKEAAIAGKVSFWPVDFTLASYEYMLQDTRFFRSFGISIIRVLLGGTINVFMCLTMGYALSQETSVFPSRNRYMWILIFTMLFNGGLVPWYFAIHYTGIMDSIWALVIPGAVPVFNVILMMNFFRNLPKSIRESAQLDGAGEFILLAKIYIPLAKPAIATIALFSVVTHWNNFFDGMVLINSTANIPLQTYIQSLTVRVSDISTLGLSAEQLIQRMSQRTFNASKIVVSTIPILFVYPFAQKYFVSGITLGSLKE